MSGWAVAGLCALWFLVGAVNGYILLRIIGWCS